MGAELLVFDGHNGVQAAAYAKDTLLESISNAIPGGKTRAEWLAALPKAMVIGFMKTDSDIARKDTCSGTTATIVFVDEWTVTVAAVGDSRCVLDTEAGGVVALTVDHRLDENTDECLGKLSRAGGEATPPLTPPDLVALLVASYTSGENADVASRRFAYEDYAVHLVSRLDQPLHVQDYTACFVSSPSATDSAASPTTFVGDSTSWSRLEKLDPLKFADFQWMPRLPTGRLPKPHCNALRAQFRDYLHTAVPAPLMDVEVGVVDLRDYLAKIDCEFKTTVRQQRCAIVVDTHSDRRSDLQRFDRLRNYLQLYEPDFLVRAGLGPRVRRKSQPTQVTLADGHTHKSIDRCIDSVLVYFAPHASEVVSFDILDTKFDMILGMSWLKSEDHPVNFYHRTVQIRDWNRALVFVHGVSTSPLDQLSRGVRREYSSFHHPRRHRGDGCVFSPHPPHDIPSTDTLTDSRISELLDAYGDIFEAPHGVVPDQPIHHEIIIEAGAVPPRGCIYRMSEEDLSVLRAQLDDLLKKGWIRPSSSPYDTPLLFVRKKNKDLRLCIGYRKFNVQTVKNADPLSRIDDLLEWLGGAKFFSKLDLKSRYHQLEIRRENRYKTAFKI
ncbi:hypothetical protein CBR_g10849 [Chara braunii]|uniref:PPM-type phosphatase domain-containing protein n=1 Tax=Chara braunii TaxID=69332 RepID=A0A388KPP5_CHABU|nr:hypothetical protein CBR_g10849 [Chara braunii]|eukprot:GBG71913.1 hypothetical protein CBR_g10849 [Chara braunii]